MYNIILKCGGPMVCRAYPHTSKDFRDDNFIKNLFHDKAATMPVVPERGQLLDLMHFTDCNALSEDDYELIVDEWCARIEDVYIVPDGFIVYIHNDNIDRMRDEN